MKPKIAISVGDLNGVSAQLILQNHKKIQKIAQPIYCINGEMLSRATSLLKAKSIKDIELYSTAGQFQIKPKKISKKSGKYSYDSFSDAIKLAKNKEVRAIVTLPIHKQAWAKAGINYVGHTDMLRDVFDKNAIMMLGCQKLFVALFTEHISLKEVAKQIKTKKLVKFFLDFQKSIKSDKIAVLGLNPHAGDNGVLGDEEIKIHKAIKKANRFLGKRVFYGALIPDIAFTKKSRQNFNYFIAMYHDQGLAPLKALYFDESVNISLNLPIVRTSVDHGTAFDIAYEKNNNLSSKSYINAVKQAVKLAKIPKNS